MTSARSSGQSPTTSGGRPTGDGARGRATPALSSGARRGGASRLYAVVGHCSEKDFRQAMGRRLRMIRVLLGISQQDLADAAGTSRNFVSAIERGAQGPDAYRLSRIAAALRMPLPVLLTGEGFDDWVRSVL
jgi:DNA-binding XRE family transcriptional regulator